MKPLLDPRTFPVERLAELTHALPAAGTEIDVADVPGGAEAVTWLCAHGRPAQLVPASEVSAPTRLWQPSPALQAVLPLLPPGRALDIGCGTGRDAVWMAMAGWDVTAIDHLPDALVRAEALAELHHVHPKFLPCDAEKEFWPTGPFDLVTVFRFLVPLKRMATALAPGGSILVETFTDRERTRTGKPRDAALVLPASNPPPLPEGLTIREYRVQEIGGRELAMLWASR